MPAERIFKGLSYHCPQRHSTGNRGSVGGTHQLRRLAASAKGPLAALKKTELPLSLIKSSTGVTVLVTA